MSASAHIFARRTLFRPRAAALGLALVLLAGACDNTVQPFAEDADALFTLSGFLSTAADTQFVRVIPLRQSLSADDEALPLGAEVTLTELQTGGVHWTDNIPPQQIEALLPWNVKAVLGDVNDQRSAA